MSSPWTFRHSQGEIEIGYSILTENSAGRNTRDRVGIAIIMRGGLTTATAPTRGDKMQFGICHGFSTLENG